MSIFSRSRRLTYIALILTLILSFALSAAVFVFAAGNSPLQLSSDPYTNTTSQHQTEVEPDSFSNGSTIVTAIVLLKERNTFERGAVRIVFASCPGAEIVL